MYKSLFLSAFFLSMMVPVGAVPEKNSEQSLKKTIQPTKAYRESSLKIVIPQKMKKENHPPFSP